MKEIDQNRTPNEPDYSWILTPTSLSNHAFLLFLTHRIRFPKYHIMWREATSGQCVRVHELLAIVMDYLCFPERIEFARNPIQQDRRWRQNPGRTKAPVDRCCIRLFKVATAKRLNDTGTHSRFSSPSAMRPFRKERHRTTVPLPWP